MRIRSLVLALVAAFAVALIAPVTAGAVASKIPSASAPHSGTIVPPVGQVQVKAMTPQPPSKSSGSVSPPFRAMNPSALQGAKLKAAAAPHAPTGNAPSVSAKPNAQGIFNGLNKPGIAAADESGNATPPDSTGAIGPTRYMEMVNQRVAVYDRSNLTLLSSTDLMSFMGTAPIIQIADPQIQWDPQANRWFYGALGVSRGNNGILLGWSKTADPSDLGAGWCQFGLGTLNFLNDYPKLGHDASFLTFGTNVFDDSQPMPWPFVTANIWAIPKPAVSDSSCTVPASATPFADATHQLKNADGSTAFTPVPANTADAATGYIVAAHDPSSSAQSKLMVWHIAAGPTLVADGDISVNSYSVPPSVPQPGVSTVLDSLDGRLTQAVAHFDPTAGAEAVWTQHTVAGSGRSVVRWYEFLPSSMSVRQQGQVASSTDFVWNGAISPSVAGDDAVVFYNRGSASLLPVIAAQTRVSNDPLGQMSGEVVLGSSSAADQETGFPGNCAPTCRWGDYSAATPDPINAGVVWGSNQLSGAVTMPAGRAQWTTQNFAFATGVQVKSVVPNSGSTFGGTVVTITGWGFTGATAVKFGSAAAATFTVNSDTQITATSPAHAAGAVDITITTPGGTGALSGTDQFTFTVPGWCATFDMTAAPTAWVTGQSQTFTVKAINCGSMTWPSTGYHEVDLDLHFATSSGGSANVGNWTSSQALALGADVTPGGSAAVAFTLSAPMGSTVLEALMIKEHQFWFDTVTQSPQQWMAVAVTVTAPPPPVWSASFDMSTVPLTWAQGVSQTFSVKVTNIGNVTWPSTGYNEVDLDLHFATSSGGSANVGNWLSSTALALGADVAPNKSATVTFTLTAPAGSTVLEALMIKEHQFWFDAKTSSPQQWAFVTVTIPQPIWSASFDMSTVPTTWAQGVSQTFSVKVTNGGNVTWPSTGYNEVDLDLHFASSSGGSANIANWTSSQALALGADVPPNGSATVTFTLTAPAGSTVLEALMIKEHQFWFDAKTPSPQQWAFVTVTIPQPIWSATIDMSTVPATWKAGESKTFSVKVTNSGNVPWPSTGYNEVDFDLHFATSGGGSANMANWLNSSAFSLPADLPSSASVTLTVTFAAPANAGGTLTLEGLMIKEHQFWFDAKTPSPQQWSPAAVTVNQASYDMSTVPTTWTAGQSKTFVVKVTNTSNVTWISTGYNEFDLDFHFTTVIGGSAQQASWKTSQAFSIPADVPPAGFVMVSVTVTAPAATGSMFLEVEMIKEHAYWFMQVSSVSATVN